MERDEADDVLKNATYVSHHDRGEIMGRPPWSKFAATDQSIVQGKRLSIPGSVTGTSSQVDAAITPQERQSRAERVGRVAPTVRLSGSIASGNILLA